MHIHVYMHTHAYISAPCFNPPRPNPISAPIPAYLGTTPKMQLSRKGSSSHMNQLGKGESCQPQRHKCQARSRDTSKRRHWRPKWVLPASCISEKEIPPLLRATEPSLTPPSCCQPIPLNPGDQTSNVILLRRLEGKKICPSIWKRMSPDLIVVLSPVPSVDGYYSMKHKLWQYSLLFLSCFQSSRYKQIILQTEIFSIWVPAPERQHNRKQVRSTIGSTLHKLTHLTLTTGLWDRFYYYTHLTVEKTEPREVKRVACNHTR